MPVTAALAVLLSQVSVQTASQMLEERTATPPALYDAAKYASGLMLCSKALKRAQMRAFDRRFGSRVVRLATAMVAKDGIQQRSTDLPAQRCLKKKRRTLPNSLQSFEWPLQTLEDMYGLGGAPLETTLCHLGADPSRFQDKRVRVRGGLHQVNTPDDLIYSLIDPGCSSGIMFGWTKLVILEEELKVRSFDVGPIIFGTFTGRVRDLSCDPMQMGVGAPCGPLLVASDGEDIVKSDQCWEYARINQQQSRIIAKPCDEPAAAGKADR